MISVALVLERVFRGFESLGVPYRVGGSFASGAWGNPRQTNDLDLSALLDPGKVLPLHKEFEEDFMVSVPEIEGALASEDVDRSFQLLHLQEFFKVDVFVPIMDEYTRSEFERSHRLEILPGVWGWCAAPENIIIQKLRWFDLGRRVSDRQWNDIAYVIDVQGPNLDLDYLREWSAHLGLSDLLQDALSDRRPPA